MPPFDFTPEQVQAIRTLGTSVVVSAAAGSGKTAVLAERCVHLICDAPPEHRCGVDELLVVTFTEAAAAEMRLRIIDALRDRATRTPGDARLYEQIALAETAQISTIHAYCLWMVRRWFSLLGIDPAATVLDASEASLLRRDVLDALLRTQYAGERSAEDPLGTHRADVAASSTAASVDAPFQERLVRLIDAYGLGNDADIGSFILRLAGFVDSLAEPDRWLDVSMERLAEGGGQILQAFATEFAGELRRQAEHGEAVAEGLARTSAAVGDFAVRVREHAVQLGEWADRLAQSTPVTQGNDPSRQSSGSAPCLKATLEHVRQAVEGYRFPRSPTTRKSDELSRADRDAREAAKGAFAILREQMFQKRLQKRYGLFSVEEWEAGLHATAPYVRTIVELLRRFRAELQAKKRALGVLEFSDLERLAYELLSHGGTSVAPSTVARAIQRRFRHVLVDEFQDVNPLQERILLLSSRESSPPGQGNLFTVGDVKQSIYRFRLAEPEVFARRLRQFRSSASPGAALSLQRNFRSRAEILDAVNRVFEVLMLGDESGAGYDDDARLYVGRVDSNGTQEGSSCVANQRARVEVHLLPRRPAGGSGVELASESTGEAVDEASDEDARDTDEEPRDPRAEEGLDEPRYSTAWDASRWSVAEREAFAIGARILEWRRSGEPIVGQEPLRFRDVAVLLRAARVKADQMASMLSRMGIPARAETGGSLFAAVEVRGVLSALRVMDNPQQDIPLAAVLRHGMFGKPLTADDLVEVRCLDRAVPFHSAVRRYADAGESESLRSSLRRVLERIREYRHEARLRPLSEVVWRLYEREGYLAYAASLPFGEQRRANLLRFHELTRTFGTFRRQGLHRFLRYVDSLEDAEQTVDAAAPLGESEDVVRIMSIHHAKGLEFPVVFVAGLGTEFNLRERRGRMIFERSAGIGLRVVDPERMIEYPSAAHLLAGEGIDRSTRQEEMRILYVAMTRARERLVLVGTSTRRSAATESTLSVPSTSHARTSATSVLDWILPVVNSTNTGADDVFSLRVYRSDEVAAWRIEPTATPVVPERALESDAILAAIARAEPLPDAERVPERSEEVGEVLRRVGWVYPFLSVTNVAATVAASAVGSEREPTERAKGRRAAAEGEREGTPGRELVRGAAEEAVRRGIATHRVLQHLDFSRAAESGGLALELQRLTADGFVSEDDAALVRADDLEWFLGTSLAQRIRRAGAEYRRELTYIAAESPEFFDPGVVCDESEFALARGMVDGILLEREGVTVVDFKTDAVSVAGVDERARRYFPQVRLYARAVERLFRRRVTSCELVFLHARTIVGAAGEVRAET